MDDLDDYYPSSYQDDPSNAAAMTISEFRDEHDGEDDDGFGRDDDDIIMGTAFNLGEFGGDAGDSLEAVGASENQGEVILPLDARQDIASATDIAIGDGYIGPDAFGFSGGEIQDSASELLSLKPAQLVRKQARFSADIPQQTTKTKQPGGGGASVDRFITGTSRKTRPVMTKFEYAAIIGERATQIEAGATNIDSRVVARARAEGIDTALDIAELELETLDADFPLTVQRRIAPNTYEVWSVRELLLPSQILCSSYSPEATRLLLGSRGDHCPHDVSKALTNSYKRFVLAENTA